jgi:hypothetical protein
VITNLTEALQLLVESSLSDINTSMPGKIVSYDAARNRAVVKPVMPKSLSNDDSLEAPSIVEVPVMWPTSGNGASSITMPIKPGDGVMLSFQQRSIEDWLNGNESKPSDPRQFDLSDCVALPGLNVADTVGHPDNMVVKFNDANVIITPDNQITIGNANASIYIDSDGSMTISAKTIYISTASNHFTLETHKHTQPQDSHGDTEQPTNQPLLGS